MKLSWKRSQKERTRKRRTLWRRGVKKLEGKRKKRRENHVSTRDWELSLALRPQSAGGGQMAAVQEAAEKAAKIADQLRRIAYMRRSTQCMLQCVPSIAGGWHLDGRGSTNTSLTLTK
jgi:hypothetical protein